MLCHHPVILNFAEVWLLPANPPTTDGGSIPRNWYAIYTNFPLPIITTKMSFLLLARVGACMSSA